MAELVNMLRVLTQEVRVTEAFTDGSPAEESTEVDNLSPETQQTRRVVIDTMIIKKLWFVYHAVKCDALVSDSLYKNCEQDTCTDGGSLFKIECMPEVHMYVAESFGGLTRIRKELAELTSHLCHHHLPEDDQAARLRQRHATRLQVTEGSEGFNDQNKRGNTGGQYKDLQREKLATFLTKEVELEDDHFCLLCFWGLNSTPTAATSTKEFRAAQQPSTWRGTKNVLRRRGRRPAASYRRDMLVSNIWPFLATTQHASVGWLVAKAPGTAGT